MVEKFKSRTRWREKLERAHPSHGKVVGVPPKMRKRFGEGTMLVPEPLKVDGLIRRIKRGKLATVNQVRARLAVDARADSACPMTTGIFIRIVAEAAEEDLKNGKKRVAPYWRVIKSDGCLNPKFPGGVRAQAARLREEGHAIERSKSKRPPRVKGFEQRLQRL